jgi:phosphonate transport system substrate-binding protein
MKNNKLKYFMHKYRLLLISFLVVISLPFITLFFYTEITDISYINDISRDDLVPDSNDVFKKVVYIGVISRYPANILYQGYQPLLDYLSSNTKFKFELKLSSDYNEAVKKLIDKEVSASFLGSFLYVKAHEQYGVIPILKPLNENLEPFIRSVVITRSDKNIFTIKDLIGKRLALPSKESFSGNWLTKIEFKKYGLKENDLKEIQNFPHHQSVLNQVLKGNYDAGVIREYLLRGYTDGNIRTIAYSDKISTSPLVVTTDYDPEIIQAIENTLLSLSSDRDKLKDVTKNWDKEFTYGFTRASDEDYNYIRQINK